MQLEHLLQDYGLTEKEARIYLSGLELWVVPASIIAKKIGENRITVYSALQMLCKKGMSSEHTKNGKKFYMMLDPKDFHRKMKAKCEKLETAVPQLLALTSTGGTNKPKVFYYEGLEGVQKIYEDNIESTPTWGSILTISGRGKMDNRLKGFLHEEYRPQRIKKNIWLQLIYSQKDWFETDEQQKNWFKWSEKQDRSKVLFIPENESPLDIASDITIYWESKVHLIMFNEDELSGVIIDSVNLHNTLKWIFNLVRKFYSREENFLS